MLHSQLWFAFKYATPRIRRAPRLYVASGCTSHSNTPRTRIHFTYSLGKITHTLGHDPLPTILHPRICPTLDLTIKLEPRYWPIVFAFAGDSTITSDLVITDVHHCSQLICSNFCPQTTFLATNSNNINTCDGRSRKISYSCHYKKIKPTDHRKKVLYPDAPNASMEQTGPAVNPCRLNLLSF